MSFVRFCLVDYDKQKMRKLLISITPPNNIFIFRVTQGTALSYNVQFWKFHGGMPLPPRFDHPLFLFFTVFILKHLGNLHQSQLFSKLRASICCNVILHSSFVFSNSLRPKFNFNYHVAGRHRSVLLLFAANTKSCRCRPTVRVRSV